jgi:YfiR/HmsC-like
MVFLACALCGLPGIARGQSVSSENRLKAIYLGKMLNFVQWPDGAFAAKDSAIQFCVEGDGLLGFALAQEMSNTTIGRRKVEVRWVQKEKDLKGCHALFVGGSGEKHITKVLESVKGANVLTLGEAGRFLEAGGVAQLSYEDSFIRLGVNLAAARNAGLKMDARLLGLAKRVMKSGEMPGG